jgi:valyl-tRNA synthetase
LSGWILDPDRKKMSKSKGNVVTPMGLLETHGSDAVRYWAASARLGTDAAFDEGQMKVGRRLAMKVLNASKFVLGATGISTAADSSLGEGVLATAHVLEASVTEPLDRAMLAELALVVEAATEALDAYDHTRALEVAESCFWAFCDDYVELVKERAYGGAPLGEAIDPFAPCSPAAASARAALVLALETFLRLFAPVLPFATEEVWSWFREGSVHRAPWPVAEPLRAAAGVDAGDASAVDPMVLAAAGSALAALRKVKSEAKVAQRAVIESVTLEVPAGAVAQVEAARADLMAAGRVVTLNVVEGEGYEAVNPVLADA